MQGWTELNLANALSLTLLCLNCQCRKENTAAHLDWAWASWMVQGCHHSPSGSSATRWISRVTFPSLMYPLLGSVNFWNSQTLMGKIWYNIARSTAMQQVKYGNNTVRSAAKQLVKYGNNTVRSAAMWQVKYGNNTVRSAAMWQVKYGNNTVRSAAMWQVKYCQVCSNVTGKLLSGLRQCDW